MVGLFLVALSLIDVAATTVAIHRGAGPVTGRLANRLWAHVLHSHHRRPSHRRLWYSGLAIVLGTFLFWLLLVVVGWSMIFNSGAQAVVSADTGAAASVAARIYYASYTVFTLGNGEFIPSTGLWQLATVGAVANGLFFAGLAITYLIPVVGAANEQRQLAGYISTLGESWDEILLRAWNGSDFGRLADHLIALTPMVGAAAQRHLAYPSLHYFHSTERLGAFAPSLAVLDEAMTALTHAVEPKATPEPVALVPARGSVLELLETLRSTFVDPARRPPPAPSLERLRAAGIPVCSDEEFEQALDGIAKRRRLLLALVEADGWKWESVTEMSGPAPDNEDIVNPAREEVGQTELREN